MSTRQGSSGIVAAVIAVVVLGAIFLANMAGAQPAKERFNHLSTGYALTGAHERAPCESCHVRGIFKGTTKDCAQCHGPGTRISAFAMSASHIPTAARCDSCHNTQQFQGARFDHATANAGDCLQCHGANSRATAKPARHIVTTASCDSCHRRTGWIPATFNHANVAAGSCAQCHNGSTASGRSVTHIPTSAACDTCHIPGAWRPASRFDHASMLPGTCNQCHNGSSAVGQKPNHIPTTAACDSCHTKTAWTPARADHTTVLPGTCATCHDGRLATGKKPTHIPTSASCDSCHRTTAWVPTSFSHQGVAAGTCANCHNGTNAAGKPAKHLPTSSSCDSCHSTGGWRPASYNHAGVAPGSCRNCHNGSIATGLAPTHVPVQSISCDSCHGNFSTFVGAPMNHGAVPQAACTVCHEAGTSWFGGKVVTRPTPRVDPVHPQTGECNACHNTNTFVTAGGKPANHIPTQVACATCHTALPEFLPAKMSHQGITNGCATCHGPGAAYSGGKPKAPPANHIPALGTACEACHNAAGFTSWSSTRMNHAATPNIPCATCHEAGRSWYGVTITVRPPLPHPNTGDCGQCHTTATFKGAANKPANHIPTTQACTLCHSNPQDYKVYAMNHQGITSGCASCHLGGQVFATNFRPPGPPATHIPTTGIACEACHSASNFRSFGATPMNHAPTGSIACATCHEAGKSWFGITTVTRPTRASHPATGDCGQCHTSTTSFAVAIQLPANHIPTTQACTLCHTNPGNYKVFTMNHQGITGNCSQCHGAGLRFVNGVPKPIPATHIPTSNIPCESCHAATAVTTWAGTRTNHAAVAALTCMTCHEAGKSWYGVAITTRPLTATHPRTGDCNACHTTTSFKGPAKPANHIPTTLACSVCHTTNDYSVAKMDHQGINNNCALCHGPNLSFAGVVPVAPPAKHIPYTGVACEACHAPTNFTTFSKTKMVHAAVTQMKCTTCHETGMSWFGVQVETRPRNHHAGQECNNSGCHSSTNTFSKRFVLPARPNPNTFQDARPVRRPLPGTGGK